MEAAGGTVLHQELRDEATCSICLDYFRDPVMIPECGHNFCKACLDRVKGTSCSKVSCPQCRMIVKRRNIAKNRSLANVAEIAKSTLRGQKRAREEGDICDKHQEPHKLFCWDDKVLICVVCDRSKEHRSHLVVPLEEASEEYKDQIKNCLKTLREKREEMLSKKVDTENESQGPLRQIELEREKTARTFRELHQVLEEQERLLLAQMEEVMEEIERERENHLDRLEKDRQSLERIIQEMEEKLHQPAVDLLQAIGSCMERYELWKNDKTTSITFPVALKWKIWDFCDVNPFLEGIIKQFQDESWTNQVTQKDFVYSLLSGLQLNKVQVHLDPETAPADLIVSEDCKAVRWTEAPQDVPHNPGRSDFCPFVLGREEFTAGRHFWEVTVGCAEEWTVGLAKKPVERKGFAHWEPKEEIWIVGRGGKRYWSYSNGSYTLLFLNEEPRKIRVALNYEGGRVAFYDADRGTLISVYSGSPFARGTLRPYVASGNHFPTPLSLAKYKQQ